MCYALENRDDEMVEERDVGVKIGDPFSHPSMTAGCLAEDLFAGHQGGTAISTIFQR